MSQNRNGLLEYIPGSHTLLIQKNSSVPLEGFAENIQVSIQEYAENAKSDVEKGYNFLQWVLTRVFEATEDDAADAIVVCSTHIIACTSKFYIVIGYPKCLYF